MIERGSRTATYGELVETSLQTMLAALEWNVQQTFQTTRAAMSAAVRPWQGMGPGALIRESLYRARDLFELTIDDAEARVHEFAKLVDVSTHSAGAWHETTCQTVKDLVRRGLD